MWLPNRGGQTFFTMTTRDWLEPKQKRKFSLVPAGVDNLGMLGGTVGSDPDMLHFSNFGIHIFHLPVFKVDILRFPKLVLFFF